MRLKILFLSHSFFPNIGGIEINSELLAEEFSRAGHAVRLVTWTPAEEEPSFSFSVIRNPGIYQLITQHAWADIIFENNPCLRLSWPNLVIRKPSIIVLNTWITRTDGQIAIQDILKKLWLSRASKVIAVSAALKDRSWKSSLVIGNPYRSDNFRKTLCHSVRQKDFVFVGRLVSDKGADQAILALQKILQLDFQEVDHRRKITLTIVGSGPELPKLKKLTTKLQLEPNVDFVGVLHGAELTECLNNHRFILVPSLWEEPFGNVVLEGMACGCIPIASDGGGLPEAVGDAGLIFKRGDLKEMIRTIMKVFKSTHKQNELIMRAELHLAKHHPRSVTLRYLAEILSIVKEGSK